MTLRNPPVPPHRRTPSAPGARGSRPEPSRARAPLAAAIILLGVAGAVVVAIGGSPVWQAARVLGVAALTVVAGLLVARAPRSGLGAVASVVGCVAVCAGAGIGGGHLLRGAMTVRGVAGLVLLVVGLGVLVTGGTLLTLTARGWWRLLALPATFLLAQFVLLPVTVAVYATNLPPFPLGARTPADAGLAYDDVVARTTDGVALAGWYVPSRNGAAVALLHGSGSTRTAVIDQAAALAGAGYGVLLYDDRGHGESGGVGMDLGWWGDADLAAAVDLLADRPDVDPRRIGVVGMSMGGEQALNAAAGDARLRVVVAEGLGPRLAGDITELPAGFAGLVDRVTPHLIVATARLLTDAPVPMPQADALAALAPRPVLLVAGRGEIAHVEALAASAAGPVEVLALPDTPHTQGLREHPEQWRQRVLGVLDEALAAG